MRRALLALLPLVFAAAALEGCGGGQAVELLPAEPASPEVAPLGWVESYGEPGAQLVFRVQRFEVREHGWAAAISVTNAAAVPFEVGAREHLLDRQFGVMVFQTGDARELEQRNRAGELPAVRPAQSYVPELPDVLEPGATWRGEISASGSLPSRSWVRISFGTFVAVGDPPQGLEPRIVWITDHAYPL